MDARTAFAWVLVAALTAVLWLLVRPFLSWLLATGLLAFVLYPVHRRLEVRVGPRLSAGLLALLVTLLVVVPLTVGAAAAVTRGSVLLEGLSRSELADQLQRTVRRTTGITLPVRSLGERASERLTSRASDQATDVLSAGLHAFLGFLLLTFVLYYLLKDGHVLVAWVRRMTPLEAPIRDELFESVRSMTWAVLKGHVLVAIVQGAVAGVSLFLTGVPEATLLTAAMMVLALIPVVGVAPVLGGAVVFLVWSGQPLSAAFVTVWGLTSVAITDDYLRAMLIDRESEMHSATVFVGVLGGTYLLGAMGLFLGPIIVGIFKRTVEVVGGYYGVIHAPDG
ncbi:AI-2E family transporter [Halostella sp. JP-L12]|uniref:AI-2E family transporter n=1 Tax=Halostella TaxID=1843185 RepID=UPI000EF78097|nr:MULTISPECIES: AI-2E family transporter [Halostella]NHN47106.1 AI-2E family transporter [Halostella sp. JP-L12]